MKPPTFTGHDGNPRCVRCTYTRWDFRTDSPGRCVCRDETTLQWLIRTATPDSIADELRDGTIQPSDASAWCEAWNRAAGPHIPRGEPFNLYQVMGGRIVRKITHDEAADQAMLDAMGDHGQS